MPRLGHLHPDGLRRALLGILASEHPEDLAPLEALGTGLPPQALHTAAVLLEHAPGPLTPERVRRILSGSDSLDSLRPLLPPLEALMERWGLTPYPWAWGLVLHGLASPPLQQALVAWHPSVSALQSPRGVLLSVEGKLSAPPEHPLWDEPGWPDPHGPRAARFTVPLPPARAGRGRPPRGSLVIRQWTPEQTRAWQALLKRGGYFPAPSSELVEQTLHRLARHLRDREPLAHPSTEDRFGLDTYALRMLYRLKRVILEY